MKGQVTEAEKTHGLLDQLQGIVIILAQGVAIKALIDVIKFFYCRRKLLRFLKDIVVIRQSILGVGIEDIGDQHRIVCDNRPPRF